MIPFNKLYADGYLPFTIAELNKADPVGTGEVFEIFNGTFAAE